MTQPAIPALQLINCQLTFVNRYAMICLVMWSLPVSKNNPFIGHDRSKSLTSARA